MRNWIRRLDERISSSLTGFGWVATAYLLAVLLVGAFVENVYAVLMVAVWMLLSHTRLSEIGVRRPRCWLCVFIGGWTAGIVLKLFVKAVVMPLFGGPPVNPMLVGLHGDIHAFWIWSLRVILFGGIVEEVIYRGYLINRLTAAWGTGATPMIGMIAATALVFGLPHYLEQGAAGALTATLGGIVLAAVYLASGKQLFTVITMHAANDVCAVWLTYAGLDDWVAHSVWK